MSDDDDDDGGGNNAFEDPDGFHDDARDSTSGTSRPRSTRPTDDDAGGCCCSSSCPPSFGDGNEEPGGHLQCCCCCPGVRISYCKLSQVGEKLIRTYLVPGMSEHTCSEYRGSRRIGFKFCTKPTQENKYIQGGSEWVPAGAHAPDMIGKYTSVPIRGYFFCRLPRWLGLGRWSACLSKINFVGSSLSE